MYACVCTLARSRACVRASAPRKTRSLARARAHTLTYVLVRARVCVCVGRRVVRSSRASEPNERSSRAPKKNATQKVICGIGVLYARVCSTIPHVCVCVCVQIVYLHLGERARARTVCGRASAVGIGVYKYGPGGRGGRGGAEAETCTLARLCRRRTEIALYARMRAHVYTFYIVHCGRRRRQSVCVRACVC